MTVRILHGDCLELLDTLPDDSVDLVVTSPPYFGLRDYGVDGQIGLEDSPEAFVDVMVHLFRKVRRVLRRSGIVYLNLGDSYASAPGQASRGGAPSASSTLEGNGHRGGGPKLAKLRRVGKSFNRGNVSADMGRRPYAPALKPKDMMMIPARVALALQADGWWLRQDIIWNKPNPMPESVRDRCTKSHEYIFHLTKSGETTCWRHEDGCWVWARPKPDYVWRNAKTRQESPTQITGEGWRRVNRWMGFDYYYEADAITEAASPNTHARISQNLADQLGSDRAHGGEKRMKAVIRAPKSTANAAGSRNNSSFNDAIAGTVVSRRNKRSVWTVGSEPFSEAHFATFPPSLIEPCILAGCPKGGVVLDPFGGAGTTGLVAERHGRDSVLIEINGEYIDIARRRLRSSLAQVDTELPEAADHGPLFDEAAA